MKRPDTLLRAALLLVTVAVLPCCDSDVGDGDEFGVFTARVSVAEFGVEALNNSRRASVSHDGRYVAFESDAVNLTIGDTNGFKDIFVKDRLTGQVENITNKGFNVPEMNDCEFPAISRDGRHVAFVTLGIYLNFTAIPTNYTNTIPHIFVYDRLTGDFRMAIADPILANAAEGLPSLSPDGRYLVFNSAATNLGYANPAGPLGGQVYLSDFGTTFTTPATVTLVSAANPTTGGNGGSGFASVSEGGSFVVFTSGATDLDAADAHSGADIYLWDQSGPTLSVVSSPTSVGSNGSFFGVLSSDGSMVAYKHRPIAGSFEARTFNRLTLATQTVSPPGTAIGSFDFIAISGDGRTVIYPLSGVATSDVFISDAVTGTQIVSVSSGGTPGSQSSFGVAISGDGRWAAFESSAPNLVSGDTNGAADIFIRGPLR